MTYRKSVITCKKTVNDEKLMDPNDGLMLCLPLFAVSMQITHSFDQLPVNESHKLSNIKETTTHRALLGPMPTGVRLVCHTDICQYRLSGITETILLEKNSSKQFRDVLRIVA